MARHRSAMQRYTACSWCHIREPVEGRRYCSVCLEKKRLQSAMQRAERKRNGECVTCGRQVVPGRTLCTEHLAYFAARQRGLAEERRLLYRTRQSLGLCVQCGECVQPVDVYGRGVFCARHRRMHAQYRAKGTRGG